MTPKPSATFGQWRKEPVTMAGRTVCAHTFSNADRQRISERLTKKQWEHGTVFPMFFKVHEEDSDSDCNYRS